MNTELFYWVSSACLWVCIVVNLWSAFTCRKLQKRLQENLNQIREQREGERVRREAVLNN